MNLYLMQNKAESFGLTEHFLKKVARVYTRCQPVVFMGMFSLQNQDGNWLRTPSPVFWQPEHAVGHSHYFSLLNRDGKFVITDGKSAFGEGFTGAIADDGEVIYSRAVNDYVESKDGSVYIDGGREYTRTNTSRLCRIEVEGFDFVLTKL